MGEAARTDELEQLERLLASTLQGRGRSAIVEGDPGLGKTWVLRQIRERARAVGAEILQGSVDPLESERPFALINDLLRSVPSAFQELREQVTGLLTGEDWEGQPGASDGGLRFRVSDAVVDLIEALCLKDRVVLLFDDLHWADPSSLFAVNAVSKRISDVPCLLLAT
ncbi:MAG TPA: ATP-binding protein, partial [Actinomycetota bacterium]|nr:ATP-binding protein [Actinomycetota bacterium]